MPDIFDTLDEAPSKDIFDELDSTPEEPRSTFDEREAPFFPSPTTRTRIPENMPLPADPNAPFSPGLPPELTEADIQEAQRRSRLGEEMAGTMAEAELVGRANRIFEPNLPRNLLAPTTEELQQGGEKFRAEFPEMVQPDFRPPLLKRDLSPETRESLAAQQAVSGTLSDLSSADQALILGGAALAGGLPGAAGRVAEAAIPATFGVEGAKGVVEGVKNLIAAKTPEERGQAKAQIGISATMLPGLIAPFRGGKPNLRVSEAIKKGEAVGLNKSAEALAKVTGEKPTTTEVPSAEAVRSNQGQLSETGQVAGGGEAPRGNDVELPASVEPKPVVQGEVAPALRPQEALTPDAELNADIARYNEIQAAVKSASEKDPLALFNDPVIVELYKENEAIKNKYGGYVPTPEMAGKTKVNAPETVTPKSVPGSAPGPAAVAPAKPAAEIPKLSNREKLYQSEHADLIETQRALEAAEASGDTEAVRQHRMERDDAIQRLAEFDKLFKRDTDIRWEDSPDLATAKALRENSQLTLAEAINEGALTRRRDIENRIHDKESIPAAAKQEYPDLFPPPQKPGLLKIGESAKEGGTEPVEKTPQKKLEILEGIEKAGRLTPLGKSMLERLRATQGQEVPVKAAPPVPEGQAPAVPAKTAIPGEPPLPTKAVQHSINQALKAAEIIRLNVKKSKLEKALGSLRLHAAKLGIEVPDVGTYFHVDKYRQVADAVTLGIGKQFGSHPTAELRALKEAAAPKPKAPRKLTPQQEFAKLVRDYGVQLGWIRDADAIVGQIVGKQERLTALTATAKVRQDTAIAQGKKSAIGDLGGDLESPNYPDLIAKAKERIKKWEEDFQRESEAEMGGALGIPEGITIPEFGEPTPPAAPPKLAAGEKGTGEMFKGADQPFNLAGEKGIDVERIAREKAEAEARAAEAKAAQDKQQSELFRTGTAAETPDQLFERARKGDAAALDDLAESFATENPGPVELELGRPSPHKVFTADEFAKKFNQFFAARNFEGILNMVKASDVDTYKPFLRDLFKAQAKDPLAATKAEWMRNVFNGTRPADEVKPPPPKPPPAGAPPKAGPPPKPKPSGPPPPPPPPPKPPPVRIAVDPLPGGTAKSPYRIIEDFSKGIGKAIRTLRMRRNVLGTYRPGSTGVAQRFAGDLDTAAHELAGHWVDDKYGVGKPWVNSRQRSPYDNELQKFWIHGSVNARTPLRTRRAEGIAEYVRARVMNPKQAKLEAPTFSAYFEKTLPPEALKALDTFSTDVRQWAGTDPLVRAGLNIRMEPPTLTEKLWNTIRGRGYGFETGAIDRLRLMFDDPYHYAVKASKMIQELRGGKVLPKDQFELTARLLATHDKRMAQQFENGLVPLRPEQMVNAKGELEVKPLVDPVTKEPMNLEWLMGAFDTANTKAFKQDMRDTSAFMVAQRTLEKAKELGREQVSGLGAGLMSDVKAAREVLDRVAKDPAQEAKLKESARRYRLWADQNIQMLVDAGRISKAQARDIRAKNEFYVDMHRLSEAFDAATYQRRGGGIGTTKDLIKRFKGSTLELDNVYANLLEQTDAIQKEAHRNVVMNNFTDSLRNIRELHGPDLKDFDQFGRQVRTGDKNTITVYKDGKAEKWQFAPEIYESLKGLGELQTNAIFSLATMPIRFTRYMITHGPSFMVRNVLRDINERSVNSRSGAKPWDVFQGYSKAELSRYEVFGGGQFGNYIVDRHAWNRELKNTMRDLVKDPKTIVLNPFKLHRAWENLAESSEKVGRMAEFRRAYAVAKKELATDFPNLSPQEIEYNAALKAAGEARGLLDFAKAGTVMRYVNQAVPFSNAAVRGLGKSIDGMRTNPGRYAMRWGIHVLLPTVAVMLWNRRDPETWEEYKQLPAFRRDFFWNLKVGDYWMTIPKPHLLGVLAGGVERILMGIMGEKHVTEGYAHDLLANAPVSDIAQASGPLKTFLELEMNRDTFRNRDIVPSWEKDLNVELRKGTSRASAAGRGIAGAIDAAGLTLDPRNVDHVLNSLGGWGNIATSATLPNRTLKSSALKATGILTEGPGATAKDVVWVFDWAKQHGKMNDPRVERLIAMRKSMFDQQDQAGAVQRAKELREYATRLRSYLEETAAAK